MRNISRTFHANTFFSYFHSHSLITVAQSKEINCPVKIKKHFSVTPSSVFHPLTSPNYQWCAKYSPALNLILQSQIHTQTHAHRHTEGKNRAHYSGCEHLAPSLPSAHQGPTLME